MNSDGQFIPLFVLPCGMGDAVMALAVARNYRKQTGKPMHIGHKCTELFLNNPDVICHPEYAFWSLRSESEDIAKEAGFQLVSLFYFGFRKVCPEYWHFYGIDSNLVAQMSSQAGLSGQIRVDPELRLTQTEKDVGRFAAGKIAVISSGVAAYKSWPHEKMQAVIDAFPEQSFIQIGVPSDPPLKGVEDCRGKFSLRQIAALLSHARLFLGPVGGMMHLARSVGCPSVILLPSFEQPIWYYSEFDYIVPENPCTQCRDQQTNPGSCPVSAQCMDIQPGQVVERLRKYIDAPRRILQSEFQTISAAPVHGLELYRKMTSFLANSITVQLWSGKKLLHKQDLQLDNRDFSLEIPVCLDDIGDELTLTLPRMFCWLYEFLNISQKDDSGTCTDIPYTVRRCFTYTSGGHCYRYPYRNHTVIHIGRLPVAEKIVLCIKFRTVPWGFVFPQETVCFSNGWIMKKSARLFYNFEQLADAVKHDSVKNICLRIKNAVCR